MATAQVGELSLDYATYGNAGDPAMVLIMGIAAQRTWWPRPLIDRLVERGLFVVTLDNRDAGGSTVLHDRVVTMEDIVAAYAGEPVSPPYTLSDMAGDVIGLLDHLGLQRAHVAGASMGGMIAQTVALEHGERVLSLTSIMSTTGAPTVGLPTDEASAALLSPRPSDRDGFIAAAIQTARVISSRSMFDEDEARRRGAETFDRGWHPGGVMRQLLAIIRQDDRTEALRSLDVPTLVIHGEEDILVQPDGGTATAEAIPGARLEMIPSMGHDLPGPLRKQLADLIADHAHAAT